MPKNTLSEQNYNDAEKLMNSDIICKNHKLLNKTENRINDSVMICEEPQIEMSPMRTEIFFVPPEFIKNPNSETLKSLSIDIDLYQKNYRILAKNANQLYEKGFKSLHNLYGPSNNIKNEVNKLKLQFEETVKNLCAPLISEQEGLDTIDINSLNEDQKDQFIEDKMNIKDQVLEFKEESDRLNKLYHKLFENIYDSVNIICNEINGIPKTVSQVQNEIDKGMKEFEVILKGFTNPDDSSKFHQSLILVKESFKKLQDNINHIQIIERINTLETQLESRKNKLESLKNKSSDIIDNLKSKSNSIKNDIIKIRKKYAQNPVELPELNASNIIIDLIMNSINSSIKPIKDENLDLKKGVEKVTISFEELEKETSLDLLFIMDITGSMEGYLNIVKSNIINIIENIPNKCPGININMGFIGYKDVEEIKNKDFLNEDFTTDYNRLKNSIEIVNAGGGGDAAEDIAWAMEIALNKSWNSNARFAILFADYPCHGSNYHDSEVDDDYQNGVEGRRNIEELIEELAKNNISLYCIKITEKTKIMYQKFKDIYNNYKRCEFEIIPLEAEKNIITNSVGDFCFKIYSKHRF